MRSRLSVSLDELAELHGEAHVAVDAHLALHEGGGGLKAAVR